MKSKKREEEKRTTLIPDKLQHFKRLHETQ